MFKRSAEQTEFVCKPCRAVYATPAQLLRHQEDRHGPQRCCTLCVGTTYLIPNSRTDNMRRHLTVAHGMPRLDVRAIKEYFVPFFEEAETPLMSAKLLSVVARSARSEEETTSTTVMEGPTPEASVHGVREMRRPTAVVEPVDEVFGFVPDFEDFLSLDIELPTNVQAFLDGEEGRGTPSPLLSRQEESREEMPRPPSPAKEVPRPPSPAMEVLRPPSPDREVPRSPSPAKAVPRPPSPAMNVPMPPSPARKLPRLCSPVQEVPTVSTASGPAEAVGPWGSIPDLELDRTAKKTTLAVPVRYSQPEPEEAKEVSEVVYLSPPASPSPPAAPIIPLDGSRGIMRTYTVYPAALPDTTQLVQGLSTRAPPRFPPRRMRVQRRGVLDPRLLFREAPSSSLPGTLAGLAARRRNELVGLARPDNVKVEYGCREGVLVKEESVGLDDGRMVTMRSSVLLQDSLKVSRSTQTQTA